MSWQAQSIVWLAKITPPTTKLGLLALANFLNDETGRLDPSLDAIAEKVEVSRDQARRIVRDLTKRGLLSVAANFNGGRPGTTQQLRLHMVNIAALIPADCLQDTASRLEQKAKARQLAKSMDDAFGISTDGTHAIRIPTGGTHAQDGLHQCSGRVAPMQRTGGTDATLIFKNPESNLIESEDGGPAASALAPSAPSTAPAESASTDERRGAPALRLVTPPPAFNGQNANAIPARAVVLIAPDFELPEEWGNDGLALGWPARSVLQEAVKFRQFWSTGNGSGTRRALKGWRQSWVNWLDKAAKMNTRALKGAR